MNVTFYISAGIAILTTFLAITRKEAIHGLLYLVVSLLATAVAFLVLGAPFAAALEVITYAGAMMVMILFAIMMLTPKPRQTSGDRFHPSLRSWLAAALLTLILLGDFVYILVTGAALPVAGREISPQQVGAALFGPYMLGVELGSMLLLAGLVGAYRLGGRHSHGQG